MDDCFLALKGTNVATLSIDDSSKALRLQKYIKKMTYARKNCALLRKSTFFQFRGLVG